MKYKVLSKEEIEQMRIEDACDPNQMSEPLPPGVAKALKDNTRRKHPELFPKKKEY